MTNSAKTNSGNGNSKDVIYIDVEDEITAIIDKVRGAKQKIVALVLPKRATVLQSIVNMKLLKHIGDTSGRHVVLITNEASLMPLAAHVGLRVAKNLQSKPEVPIVAASQPTDDEDTVEEASPAPSKQAADKQKPVGDLAGSPMPEPTEDAEDTIELDNALPEAAATPLAAEKTKKAKKKFKIPDFNKFRLLLLAGGAGLVILILLFYVMFAVMPHASIAVKTNSSAINAALDVTLTSDKSDLNIDNNSLPSWQVQTSKTTTQQADATGQKDKGTKATGKVTLSLTDCSQPQVAVPAGTGVSTNGLTFVTQQSATLSSVKIGSQCKNADFPSFSTATVDVVAQNAGDKYNVGPTSYAVAGFSDVSGSGSQMSGGTSNVVKVVAQSDIDGAKQKLTSQDTAAVKQELQQNLANQGYYAIVASFNIGDPAITTSANAGDEVSNVVVTQKVSYTMLGVRQGDLQQLIAHAVSQQVDSNKQKILDYGLSNLNFNMNSQTNAGMAATMQTTVIAGPELNTDTLKKEVAGKKTGDAKEILKSHPGVTDADIKYSPFWVSSIPKKTGKINITIQKPDTTKNVKS